MQQFVIDIADAAHNVNPKFIVIPQNGIELAYDEGDRKTPAIADADYINAVNGLGVEELFYNEKGAKITKDPDDRLGMLQTITTTAKKSVKIMVSDYVLNSSARADSIALNSAQGFISFPRDKDNYDYKFVPTEAITNVNSNDITDLSKAQNYLYLINSDDFVQKYGSNAKDEFLTAIKNTDYDVVLIDLFFDDKPNSDHLAFTKDEIDSLKVKHNGGQRLVIAYMNIGSAENWRYYWQKSWGPGPGNPDWLRKKYDGYTDEIWVEFWADEWQDIIYRNNDSYLNRILAADFDGVYLDNVEAYYYIANDN